MKKILVVAAGPFTRQMAEDKVIPRISYSGLASRGYDIKVLEPMRSGTETSERLQSSFWKDVEGYSIGASAIGGEKRFEDRSSQLSVIRIKLFCQILKKLACLTLYLINGVMQPIVRASNILRDSAYLL
jgi:hypothetical protein